MKLADRVKCKRIELGLSQEELAKRMGYSSRTSINKIENGRKVSQKIIVRLAEVLNVTPAYLMGWEDEPKENDTSEIMTIGNLFQYLRKQRNLSIEEFAEETGLTAESIRAYEKGAGGIPAEIVKMLADFFDISVDKLVAGKVKGKDIFAAFASTNEAYVKQVTKWVEVFGNERFSDEEFEKIIEFAKFILSQRKN